MLYFGAQPVPPVVFDLSDLQRASFLTEARLTHQAPDLKTWTQRR